MPVISEVPLIRTWILDARSEPVTLPRASSIGSEFRANGAQLGPSRSISPGGAKKGIDKEYNDFSLICL